MGYRLVGEVLDHCPDLPYREFRVLMALALDATDSTRQAMPGLDAITLRSNSGGHRTAKRALAALRDRGLIKAVRHAAPGLRAIYEIAPMPRTGATELTPESGATEVAPERVPPTDQRVPNSRQSGATEVAHTESNTESSTSLSRVERELHAMLADLGADMRETFFVIHKFDEDPSIRQPRAYLRQALANGDGPALIAEEREHLAELDRWREARKRQMREAEPEPEPAPAVALVPEPEPLPAEPDDGDDGEPEPESLSWWPGDELTDVVDAEEWAPF